MRGNFISRLFTESTASLSKYGDFFMSTMITAEESSAPQ